MTSSLYLSLSLDIWQDVDSHQRQQPLDLDVVIFSGPSPRSFSGMGRIAGPSNMLCSALCTKRGELNIWGMIAQQIAGDISLKGTKLRKQQFPHSS